MDNITDEMSENIYNHGQELGIEGMELVVDNFLDEGLLKEIPILKSLYATFKLGHSIRNIHFTKKIIAFLNEYNKGEINIEKLEKIKVQMESDNNYKRRVIDHVLITIDRFNDNLKSRIFSKLFIAYINGQYDWDSLIDLSLCIENLFLSDLKLIKSLIQLNRKVTIKEIEIHKIELSVLKSSAERLKNFGFLDFSPETFDSISDYMEKEIYLSKYGLKFYNLCLINII